MPYFHRGNLKDWKLTTFNAKAETIRTSRTYRGAFERRRCLVGADGWWQWNGPKDARQKWLISPRDPEPIMLICDWLRPR